MNDVRFVLTKPVPNGYAFWGIVRQVRNVGNDGWTASPDFQLVTISVHLPGAEDIARTTIKALNGVVIGEDDHA